MKKGLLIAVAEIAVAAVILFAVSAGTADMAARNAAAERVEMMLTLLPGSASFTEEAYEGEDEAIDWVYKAENGYVIQTTTAGYVGDVTLMVGVDNSGYVTGVVVRDMNETFGIGANTMADTNFLSQFLNTSGEAEVGTNVDALTGATVTSKAVTKGVNAAVAFATGADVSSGATEWGG